jgi:hypothetical protein
MPNYIEEFAIRLGWDYDPKGLQQAQGQMKDLRSKIGDLGQTLKRAAVGMAGFVAATIGFTAVETKAVRETQNLANAVNLSAESLEAWGNVAQGIGLGMDNIVDLAEEMNNKIGEMETLGEMTSLEEGLKGLNLQYKDLKDLAPEKQFETILSTAKDLADEQRAVSAVDMIFGGEANKVLGHLRSYEGSLENVLGAYKQLNFQTEESRQGAITFADSWANLTSLFKSIRLTFAGFLGEALEPLTTEIILLASKNKELIQTRLKEWAIRVADAFRTIVSIGRRVGEIVAKVVDKVGGFENVVKMLGGAFVGLKLGGIVASFLGLAKVLGPIGVALGGVVGGVIGLAAALIADDLYHYFTGGESAIGLALEKLDEFVIKFAEFLGMDPDDLKEKMTNFFDDWYDGVVKVTKAMFLPGEAIKQIKKLLRPLGDNNFFASIYKWIKRIQDIAPPLSDLIEKWTGVKAPEISPILASTPFAPIAAIGSAASNVINRESGPSASTTRNEIRQTNNIRIRGDSPEEIARQVEAHIKRTMDDAVTANDNGVRR